MDEFKKNAFRKMEDESFDEYMMRIGKACHEHNLTQDEAAEILNDATGSVSAGGQEIQLLFL